jgi:UDP-glucose 4-epimerase
MRVMVTGAAGRLGRTVAASLADRHEVIAVDRDPAAGIVGVDLLDRAALLRIATELRPDAIVHLAAIAVPFSAPEERILEVNRRLGENVLAVALETGVPRVLAASSPTVYGYGRDGWLPSQLPLDEDEPPQPWHAYALSKVFVEELAAQTARAHPELRVATFRPGYVIAPEEWEGAPTQQGHTVADRLRDPALAAVSLFNYIDAGDVGDFAGAWLTTDGAPSGARYNVIAPDALGLRPTRELVAEHLPALAGLAGGIEGHAALFSGDAALRDLGWIPRHNWRTRLPAAALAGLGAAEVG